MGSGAPPIGTNKTIAPLDRVRVDSTKRALTTNQGVPVGDNQNSLKAGLRGPTLLEDFILREKITHFDHERIPERIVHARGSAAHGYFECYESLEPTYTRASLFAEAGKQTPVFVRFSTVLGERGSTDTARDVRGFAVKFYTDEGNWDLVGNNIPIFFIQDAMKFPDLVHAAKPEPHFAMPQAGTAHDTFWDFASLMPEITAMLMWAMSDRAIPRSYRTMQGFGVHTFRFVNAGGRVALRQVPLVAARPARTRWSGTRRSKISGADPGLPPARSLGSDRGRRVPGVRAGRADLHRGAGRGLHLRRARRDEDRAGRARAGHAGRQAGAEPQSGQLLRRDRAGRLLHRARRARASTSPTIRCSPAASTRTSTRRSRGSAGRTSTRFRSTRRSRRCTTTSATACTGRRSIAAASSYEPNSLGGGCPFQAGSAGFVSFPEPREPDAHKVRGKPERFADHYTQATLFWNSQTDVEKAHIVNAFRFELSRVQTPAIRERMVSGLMNVAPELAEAVADGPRHARDAGADAEGAEDSRSRRRCERSPALSLFARPGRRQHPGAARRDPRRRRRRRRRRCVTSPSG